MKELELLSPAQAYVLIQELTKARLGPYNGLFKLNKINSWENNNSIGISAEMAFGSLRDARAWLEEICNNQGITKKVNIYMRWMGSYEIC